MQYSRIEQIKAELDDSDTSLLMLQDLKRHIDAKINAWGKESGKQFRIM